MVVVTGFRDPIETPPALRFVFNNVRPSHFLEVPPMNPIIKEAVPHDELVLI